MDAVKQALALPVERLHEALVSACKGTAVQVEASIVATALLEGLCRRVLKLSIRVAAEEASSSDRKRSKAGHIHPSHIQRVLRGTPDLFSVVSVSAALTEVVNDFLDAATAQDLPPEQLLGAVTTSEADEETLIQEHAKAQEKWKHNPDDLVSDVDLVRILKTVHPAYALAHDSIMFLISLVRELGNDCWGRIRSAAGPADGATQATAITAEHASRATNSWIGGKLLKQVTTLADFALRSYHGTYKFADSIVLKCHRLDQLTTSGTKQVKVPKAASLIDKLSAACKGWRAKPGEKVEYLYHGQELRQGQSAEGLGILSHSDVFIVDAKWWVFKRRDEARRGLLTSLKYQTTEVKKMQKVQSKLKEARMAPASFTKAKQQRKEKARRASITRQRHAKRVQGSSGVAGSAGAGVEGMNQPAVPSPLAGKARKPSHHHAAAVESGRRPPRQPRGAGGQGKQQQGSSPPAGHRNGFGFVGKHLAEARVKAQPFRLIESPALGCRPDLSKVDKVQVLADGNLRKPSPSHVAAQVPRLRAGAAAAAAATASAAAAPVAWDDGSGAGAKVPRRPAKQIRSTPIKGNKHRHSASHDSAPVQRRPRAGTDDTPRSARRVSSGSSQHRSNTAEAKSKGKGKVASFKELRAQLDRLDEQASQQSLQIEALSPATTPRKGKRRPRRSKGKAEVGQTEVKPRVLQQPRSDNRRSPIATSPVAEQPSLQPVTPRRKPRRSKGSPGQQRARARAGSEVVESRRSPIARDPAQGLTPARKPQKRRSKAAPKRSPVHAAASGSASGTAGAAGKAGGEREAEREGHRHRSPHSSAARQAKRRQRFVSAGGESIAVLRQVAAAAQKLADELDRATKLASGEEHGVGQESQSQVLERVDRHTRQLESCYKGVTTTVVGGALPLLRELYHAPPRRRRRGRNTPRNAKVVPLAITPESALPPTSPITEDVPSEPLQVRPEADALLLKNFESATPGEAVKLAPNGKAMLSARSIHHAAE